MRAKLAFSILFYCIALPALAQSNMVVDAFEEFSTARFWQYEQIVVTWNMEGSIQADLNDGINYLLEEEPVLAETSFSAVLEKDSTLWQAYYFRASARKLLRELPAAQRDLQQVMKLHPDFYEGYMELAKVHYLRGHITECERAVKSAIRLDKTKPIAYYLKGDMNIGNNQIKAAINNYKDCLEADSLFHDARIKLAILDLIDKKNKPIALQRLTQVLKYDSLQKSALLFRSIILFENDKQQSVRDLSNLIVISPNNQMARYLRGILFTSLKNYDKAFLDFKNVIEATSVSDNEFSGSQNWIDKKIDMQNVGAYTLTRVYGLSDSDAVKIKEAYCHIINGDYMLGVGILNQTTSPMKEPLSLYLIAVAYEHKGDHLKAFNFYDQALRLDDDIADAHKKRGIYEQNIKAWNKSVEDFTTALRLTPNAFILHKLRGTSYFYDNKFKEAIADFTEYLKNDSTNKEVMGSRGLAYLKVHERMNGYMDLTKAGTLQEIHLVGMTSLMDSIIMKGDTARTIYYLNYFTSKAPFFTEGYARKFKIHVKRNEWKVIDNEIANALRNSRVGAPDTDHAYLLTLQAMFYANHGHQEDALTTFGVAIKVDNKNALAYLERGKVLLSMGKKSKAESDWKQAIALGNTEAKQLLASQRPK